MTKGSRAGGLLYHRAIVVRFKTPNDHRSLWKWLSRRAKIRKRVFEVLQNPSKKPVASFLWTHFTTHLKFKAAENLVGLRRRRRRRAGCGERKRKNTVGWRGGRVAAAMTMMIANEIFLSRIASTWDFEAERPLRWGRDAAHRKKSLVASNSYCSALALELFFWGHLNSHH